MSETLEYRVKQTQQQITYALAIVAYIGGLILIGQGTYYGAILGVFLLTVSVLFMTIGMAYRTGYCRRFWSRFSEPTTPPLDEWQDRLRTNGELELEVNDT